MSSCVDVVMMMSLARKGGDKVMKFHKETCVIMENLRKLQLAE